MLVLLNLGGECLRAQDLAQTIRGEIVDSDSRMPLIGATIIVLGSDPILGASTDIDGRFSIYNVPVGRQNLVVQYIGYEAKSISQIDVGSAKQVVLKIEMLEAATALKEVVVKAKKNPSKPNNEMSVVSTRSFSLEQSERFAASMNDPGRMALSFAGVNLTDDVTNEISIRGNSPKGLLWRLEGVEIPVPNHFNIDGIYAGNVSILSNNLLDRSDFSTGAFAAEYGNALSGVFDLHLRTGNDHKREYTVQVGFLGIEASAEGPFIKGKRSSYLINYRYSTLGLFKAVGANLGGDLNTGFQDLNMKFNFPTNKLGIFSVFAVGGLSDAGYEAERDSTKWSTGWDKSRVQEDYSNHFLATGIGHKFIINSKNYVHTTLAYTRSGNRLLHSYLTDSLELMDYWNYNVNNSAVRIAIQGNAKFNSRNHLRYGFNYNRLMFDLEDRWAEGWGDFYNAKGEGNFFQIYGQHKFRINSDITFIGGLHASYFDVNGKFALEPRIAFDWKFAPKHKLSLGSGMHSRQESMAFYFIQEEGTPGYINRYLDNTRAVHVVLGYDYRITPNLNLHAEAYYQHLYGVPVRAEKENSYSAINDNDSFEKRKLTNEGTGTNYGLELTIDKSFSKNYYVLVTGSFYNSLYQGSDGEWRNTRYNGNYISSLTAGKDFRVGKKGKNVIGLNIKFFYAGGRRITPINLEASIEAGKQVSANGRFEGRVDDYLRLDARIRFKHNLKKVSWEVSVDVQNATNYKNEFTRIYNPATETIVKKYQQGIIPVLKFRVEF
ncbi:MAG: hypothetical protein ACI9UR_002724 [Bacteroidia bacterium]|jgi:hypothetical protein